VNVNQHLRSSQKTIQDADREVAHHQGHHNVIAIIIEEGATHHLNHRPQEKATDINKKTGETDEQIIEGRESVTQFAMMVVITVIREEILAGMIGTAQEDMMIDVADTVPHLKAALPQRKSQFNQQKQLNPKAKCCP